MTHTKRGFTTTEMLIAVSIVSIASAIVLSRVDYTSYRLDSAARGLRATVQRTQAQAVTSQHNELLAFDLVNQRVYVVDDVNNDLTVDPGDRVTSAAFQDGVVFGLPADTWVGAPTPSGAITASALATVTVNGLALPTIVFRSDGAASTDAQIYVTSLRGLSTDFRGVSIMQTTGRTDWYKRSTGTWALAGF
jgi:prepilin-type N-terminal cleavage/methylation domain-containing protein